MAKYPQQHLEIPVAVLAMDTIGHLTSRGHQWALTAIYKHKSYVFSVPMKEKSAENIMHGCLSGMFSHKAGSIAILSDNGTEVKNTTFNEANDQLSIKRVFSNQFHPKGTQEPKPCNISSREHLLNF